jgi:hypothetical protein
MRTNEATLRIYTKRLFTDAGREGRYFTLDTIGSRLGALQGKGGEHQVHQVAIGIA